MIQRRVKPASNLTELRTAYPPGSDIVYIYGSDWWIDRPLLQFLHGGRVLKMNETGVAVAITMPAEKPETP